MPFYKWLLYEWPLNQLSFNYQSFLEYDSEWDSCDWVVVKNILIQILTPTILNIALLVVVSEKFEEFWKNRWPCALIKNNHKITFSVNETKVEYWIINKWKV